jgi:hypothetical protein
MFKRKCVRLSVLGVFFVFLGAAASAQTPYGSFTQLEYHEFVDASITSVEGFCYGGGFIWAMSWDGELIKIDPAGSLVSIVDILTTNCNGGICYDSGTLWVATDDNQILPFDIDGNSLGSGIDLSGLPEPFSGSFGDVYGLVKDEDGFWLYNFWVPMIFKIDMSGNIVENFPNSWLDHGQPTIAKQGDKIYKFTYNWGRSLTGLSISGLDYYDYYEVLAIDVETGNVTDSWEYPNDYPQPIGLSLGDGCFWTLEFATFDNLIGIRRLAIPDPYPLPDLPSTEWGDFTIKSWGYPPVKPPMIGGMYGFGYDLENDTIWTGTGFEQLWAAADFEGPIFPMIGTWDSRFNAEVEDIAFYDEQMWLLEHYSTIQDKMVAQVQIVDGSLQFIAEWPAGMGKVAGLATNGTNLWVSGRIDYQTTGDPMNTIRKFDLAGNLVAEFSYPETTNYEDLAWHKGGLWAIHMSTTSVLCEIHKIDIDTGTVLETYQTGWVRNADDHIYGTLASNGESLLTFAALSLVDFEMYEGSRLRLLEIQLPSDQVPVKSDFNGDGQDDILWRNYITGQDAVWFMEYTAGGMAALGLNNFGMMNRAQVDRVQDRGQAKIYWSPIEAGDLIYKSEAGVYRTPMEAAGLVYESEELEFDWERLGDAEGIQVLTDPGDVEDGEIRIQGLAIGGTANLCTVTDTNWQIVGTGDFNGDEKVDILWRNYANGKNSVWYMNGVAVIGGANLCSVTDTNWQIVGTGDFNGDEKVDILWRNYADGKNSVWYMNGVAVNGGTNLCSVTDTNWHIEGTGDFNGDTKVDILWRHYANGKNSVWYMNGVAVIGGANLCSVTDTNWQIVGTGDFNGDEKVDILWRHYANGKNSVWYMNGVAVNGGTNLCSVTDTNWKIENH